MKKKNITRNIIIVMVVLTIVLSVILAAVNILSAQLDTSQNVTGQRETARLADEIQYMAESSDLTVQYYNSNQRVGVYFVGREGYYQLQYNTDAKRLYLCEGTYTSTATTDEIKISEATFNNSGLQPYADNVLSISISGADSNGYFTSGEMKIAINVEVDGASTRKEFVVKIPQEA